MYYTTLFSILISIIITFNAESVSRIRKFWKQNDPMLSNFADFRQSDSGYAAKRFQSQCWKKWLYSIVPFSTGNKKSCMYYSLLFIYSWYLLTSKILIFFPFGLQHKACAGYITGVDAPTMLSHIANNIPDYKKASEE